MATDEKKRGIIYKRTGNAGHFVSDSLKTSENAAICKIAHTCKTCLYINQNYQDSLKAKYEKALALPGELGVLKSAHLEAPKPAFKTLNYRNHAKLSVRATSSPSGLKPDFRFAIGIYQPGTHNLVDITNCPLHRETINAFLVDLKGKLETSGLSPFEESSCSGDLRYVAVRSSHLTNELMVTYVVRDPAVFSELKKITMSLRDMGHQVQCAYGNVNGEVGNVIFGTETSHLLGGDKLREGLCGFSFEIGPTSFFQVNPWEATQIYRRIEQLIGRTTNDQIAWDFYSGIGQIALVMAKSGYRVLGIEMNSSAVADAEKNAARNLTTNLPTFFTGKVEDTVQILPSWARSPKLIVTNPSRKGLAVKSREFLAATLKANESSQLIYMSCEMDTLAKDLEFFHNAGLKVRQLEAFDMFPFTEKLEWLAVIR